MSPVLSRRRSLQTLGALAVAASPASRAFGQRTEIVIGQTAHLSGPLAATLAAPLRGQALALEEFNRQGGVGGRPVRLVTLDDGYEVERSVANVRTLIDQERVTALFGLASAANVAAVLPLLAERKVPLFGVYTGAPALRETHHPYFFTTMANYRDEVVQMVRNVVAVQRRRVALAYHDNPFGLQMLPVVEAVCREHGAELVARSPLDLAGHTSQAVCRSLADAKPQAVIFMAFGPALVPFTRAARAHVNVPVYAPSIANARPLLAALGDEARGLTFTQLVPFPTRATTPLTKDYAVAMERARLPVDFDHFFGYLNMRALLETLKRAGRNVTAQTLPAAIESMGRLDLGGYVLQYGPGQHHGSSFVDLLMVGPGGRYIR